MNFLTRMNACVLGNGYSLTASACSRRTLFVFSGFFLVALLRSKCSLLMEKTGECTNAHTHIYIYESPFYLNTLALDESFVLISLL